MKTNLENGYLFTDQYQLTMAQLYFKLGYSNTTAVFDHFFRRYPNYGTHKAGYCIYAGLQSFLEWLTKNKFGEPEITALKSQKDRNGKRIFDDDFLKYLQKEWSLDNVTIKALGEGRIVHPNEPITTVKAPLPIAQIIETALLNIINFQILTATKAARIKFAAKDNLVMEFGTRRAHNSGANFGIRGALIGGADFSSNVGISYKLNLPPKGTHAHSMIQFFLSQGYSELDAFQAYADQYPDNCILLVDTIDTIQSGIPNAIKVFEQLKRKGHKPVAVRLDSGNLAELSVEASKMLDQNNMEDIQLVLSGDLDELKISEIHNEIRNICKPDNLDADKIIKKLTYGVGTKLITSTGDPALSGVYKLSAVERDNELVPIIKLSDTKEKSNNPGEKDLYRIYSDNSSVADIVALKDETINPDDYKNQLSLEGKILRKESLLNTVFEKGKIILNYKSIDNIRKDRQQDFEHLEEKYKEIVNPPEYPVILSRELDKIKTGLIDKLRKMRYN